MSKDYVLRTIDTNKWYWCKCENCGWEDSSEYCEGGNPIGETGDYTDPVCPVCNSNKLDGDPACDVSDSYNGVKRIKIPFDVFIEPYKKAVERANRLENEKYWDSLKPSTPPQPKEVAAEQAASAHVIRKYGRGLHKEVPPTLYETATHDFISGAQWQSQQPAKPAPEEWIDASKQTPPLVEGKDYSENVLAICGGKLMVMAYSWIYLDEDSGYAWCNCYGDINGDPDFDDEYNVTHWMPLPQPPSK